MAKEMQRLGGRSARIQQAVHDAVRVLGADRASLTVPMVAEAAGVTPSTIYRRWGDMADLLADVAVERMRPVCPPQDTGSARGDLLAYALQLADEMASTVGRAMLRDVIVAGCAPQCRDFTLQQLTIINDRAMARGEGFDPELVTDLVIAPILMRILHDQPVDEAFVHRLVARI